MIKRTLTQRAVAIRALGWRLHVELGNVNRFGSILLSGDTFGITGQSPLPRQLPSASQASTALRAVLLFSFAVTFGEVVETLLLSPITIALAAVFVLGCVIVLIWVFRGSGRPTVYLSVVDSLLTPAEKIFYEQLDLVIDGRLQILCKVRLADLIEVESRQPEERNRVFRRIASKHIDFILAEPGTLAPMLAIELDDSSHERADRRERDEYLEELFQTVRFPLLRIK
ncbi:MAG TPA: DUF2726 domain-containing protein, partial [Chthoniobacterales bacterium]|nr:DUF2726 domain-containing protein [Chthoniobacterales bacterium]